MVQAKFDICVPTGRFTVTGFKSPEGLIGIDNRPEMIMPWTATLLHTGTTINSLFEGYRHAGPLLLARVALIEAICLPEFYSLFDLPWGATAYQDHHVPAILAIQARAKL